METEGSKNCLPSDECTKNPDLFFANGLYNSCKATDELIKNIEESHDEALAKKALALYQRRYLSLKRPWDHVTFMYGLGLIYMHFNAYHWAVKAFREAIYVQPSFLRARDVHTRLGLIFKSSGRYKLSEKHFVLAISDTRPESGTITRLELEFHLAHLCEIQGKYKQAKEAYERLLQENNLPQQLSANINRQLGWMFFHADLDPSTTTNKQQNVSNNNHQQTPPINRIDTALSYLNTAYRTDNDSRTSYYIGRCFTNIGKFQNAFASYRSVIDREESTADTWCSIGVLYHRQNQLTDALQAYIRAVQFDKKHSVAWMNLGILYESHNQFHDALNCYKHVLRSSSNDIDLSLKTRIKYLQKHISDLETSLSNNGKLKSPDKLLSLEHLWNLESKTSLEQSTNHISPKLSASCSLKPSSSKIETPQVSTSSDRQDNEANRTVLNNALTNDATLLSNCANKIEPMEVDQKSKPLYESGSIELNENGDNQCLLNEYKSNQLNSEAGHDTKSIDSKDFNLNQLLTNGASKDSGVSSNSSNYADCTLVPSQDTDLNSVDHTSAEQVIEAFRNLPKPRKLDINVLNDDDRPPDAFPRVPPYPPIPDDQLFPSPPCMFLETKKDSLSKKLQDCCLQNPVSIVRNLASVLKLDLGLFSTKSLVETNPDHQIDITTHKFQPTKVNNDNELKDSQNIWSCKRFKSSSTISNYANYQVKTFRESLQEEREKKTLGSKINQPTKECDSDSNDESGSINVKRPNLNGNHPSGDTSRPSSNQLFVGYKGPDSKKIKRDQPESKPVRSAERIDLSDDKKWRPQLNELYKLPNFAKCVSASNMLAHIGAPLIGINTIIMGMHVPGCRFLGNRTPNKFCSVNLNVGPGDYEWCAIASEHSETFSRLCNKNGFDLEDSDWWPRLSDLQKYNIPVYRFTQRPGDMVWVNTGTIFWVQATGWSNNINWNVGPLSAKQYKSASESTEFNKLLWRKSEIPLVQLTWNIVININIIVDDELHHRILNVMRKSLGYCALVLEIVEQSKLGIYHAKSEPGPRAAKYCALCESEVFNITLVRKQNNQIHCIECALRFESSLSVYDVHQEYSIELLKELHDNFIVTKRKFQAHQRHLAEKQRQQQELQEAQNCEGSNIGNET